MGYFMDEYDVAVIGAGHAGCEAALAAARLGCRTIIFTLSLDTIANLPCNPSIGGTAKGHLVFEIDALGGEMARAADASLIQSRMLNRGKGPAVHSLRIQADRTKYHRYMKLALENQDSLSLKQAEITSIAKNQENTWDVMTRIGGTYKAKAVIIAGGTYLNGLIHIGDESYESGPDNVSAATFLTKSLKDLGISLRRFKTGSPARVHKRSLNFDKLILQEGDENVLNFSSDSDEEFKNLRDCYMTYTNEETHEIIRANLHRAAMYSGKIEGVGPRYCPSIEDKVVRFAQKNRHQFFVEPMGLDTNEYYLQGMATSLPEDVQVEFMRSIEGLENVEIMRPAYAIEYDCCDSTTLLPTLEFKDIDGLFGAGQFNGSSGYEEAAAQGLIAGINAAHKVKGKDPFILDRASSYIGTLIDDLVTKGCNEPYRMMTSRSEYRLILRQDNADQRLMPRGHEIGLVSDEKLNRLKLKIGQINEERMRLSKTTIPPSKELNDYLESVGTAGISTGIKLAELLKRPQVTYDDLAQFDKERQPLSSEVTQQIEIAIKYEGYIAKQLAQVEQMRRFERRKLPDDIDYNSISGLRIEAREKLSKFRPLNVGQASRISGVSPADISVLVIWLTQNASKGGVTDDE
ncbi:MAG: tRNA uridine-5-carboxymethylaminomethyl(34) synthesis enzyme MnmG [Clostridiales bacterium]|nr:tRNA uridine-5-carboxymethylaminomethyl(34) synthesis enzyme MnmG [Clostridiales bacterium]